MFHHLKVQLISENFEMSTSGFNSFLNIILKFHVLVILQPLCCMMSTVRGVGDTPAVSEIRVVQ
jgi:hypothetical protein